LHVDVEGYSDREGSQSESLERANSVRDILVGSGLSASRIFARGLGNSRPLASNATAAGREENRRVEILISGDPIGDLPVWDHTYTISRR